MVSSFGLTLGYFQLVLSGWEGVVVDNFLDFLDFCRLVLVFGPLPGLIFC